MHWFKIFQARNTKVGGVGKKIVFCFSWKIEIFKCRNLTLTRRFISSISPKQRLKRKKYAPKGVKNNVQHFPEMKHLKRFKKMYKAIFKKIIWHKSCNIFQVKIILRRLYVNNNIIFVLRSSIISFVWSVLLMAK